MQSIREVSGDLSGQSGTGSRITLKKDLPTIQTYNNKINRNNSYSSSILQTPVLPNYDSYSFANISDNKNSKHSNSKNLNDFIMSKERTVKRDFSYRSSIRRKRTTTIDYLENNTISGETKTNFSNARYSCYGRNDIARRPTLDPFYSSANNNSPNINSMNSSKDGSNRNSNYVHSGFSNTNSFAIRQQNKLDSNENLDLNQLTSKLSLSSLITGTSSIAQVSVFRTSQSHFGSSESNNNAGKNESSQNTLHVNKVRNTSSLTRSGHSRIISRSFHSPELKRVVSINKTRKVSQLKQNKTNLLHKFELYLSKFGKFTRKQIIKLKLLFKKAMLKSDALDKDATMESFKQLSRTASSLNSDSRINAARNKRSKRIASSVKSEIDPNNTFYNNITKNEHASRSNSVRRNLSIKLQDLINERKKSLHLKLEKSSGVDSNTLPLKAMSLRRSPSSMKRAVSTITTNTLKNDLNEDYATSSTSSQQTAKDLGVQRQYDQMGSVKLTRLNLEPLAEVEGNEEDLTIKSNTVVSHTENSNVKEISRGTSVYEDAIEYTENEMSLISYYNNTTANNCNNTSTVTSAAPKSINHKPSNIRVISGKLDDADERSVLSILAYGTEDNFSYDNTNLGNETKGDKAILLEYDESEEEEVEHNKEKKPKQRTRKNNSCEDVAELKELTELLYAFLMDIITKKVIIQIELSRVKLLSGFESPHKENKPSGTFAKSNNYFYKNTRAVTRSFSLPIGFK